jgi:hypothetical protein
VSRAAARAYQMSGGGSPARPVLTPTTIVPSRAPLALGATAAPTDEEEAGSLLLPELTPFMDGDSVAAAPMVAAIRRCGIGLRSPLPLSSLRFPSLYF